MPNITVHTKLQTSLTPRKTRNSKKYFYFETSFLRWRRFLMIRLTFLYDEYIDRPKFSERKKNAFEYIPPPPPPTSGVGTINTTQKLVQKEFGII